ncbi:hypothetical protein [Burkholderia pseudomallei]|uniref:hypothetical protein n=1 Tax=Burkholderia pseudomallei TaxID=28450 RepID=UPI00117738CE|nr:hypothetical protein [Burkholderia pseudomallei]
MTSKPTDDLLQRCRELLELNEKGESQQTALRALAATYDREITAHDRRAVAVSQTHLEAMRALLASTQQLSGLSEFLRNHANYIAAKSPEVVEHIKKLRAWADALDAMPKSIAQQPSGEVTDIELLNAMAPHLNDADGGYIVDYAAQSVVAAGRAAIAINAARTQGGES